MKIYGILVAVLAAMAVGAGAPQVAQGGHWWWTGSWPQSQANPTPDGSGRVVHLDRGHRPALSFRNAAVNGTQTALEHARGEWSNSWAMDLYNSGASNADVVAWDGYWCGVPWSGIASPKNFVSWDHYTQSQIQLTTCPPSYAAHAEYRGTRAVACQEIGHAIGAMGHEGPGCMGFGNENQVWAGSNWLGDDRVLHPSGHDFDHVAALWDNRH